VASLVLLAGVALGSGWVPAVGAHPVVENPAPSGPMGPTVDASSVAPLAPLPVLRTCLPTSGCTGPASTRPATPLLGLDAWTNVSGGQRFAPPPTVGASLAYDLVDNYLVLFGGCSATACPVPAATWKFAGGNWSEVPVSGPEPPARSYASMTYDSKDGYVVLFGGWSASGQPLNDTWSYSGGAWTNLTTAGPAPPAEGGASMTFDHSDSYVLLFGGGANGSAPGSPTWRYVAGTWKNLTAIAGTPPTARADAGLAWDDADGYAVLFGGANGTGVPTNDTWTYARNRWTPANLTTSSPSPRSGAVLSFSGQDNAVLMFGGLGRQGVLNDTWRYGGGRWVNYTGSYTPSPGARADAAFLDSSLGWNALGLKQRNGYLLVVGGGTPVCRPCASVGVNESWVFEPVLQASATPQPSVVEVGQPTTLSAVVSGGSAPYLLSWQFGDGSGTVATSPAHAFRAVGMYTVTVNAVDRAGVSFRATTTVSVVGGPSVTVALPATTTDVGRPLWFNASASGGTAPYALRWDFGDSTSATGGAVTHAFTLTGTFACNVTATDAVGGVGVASFAIHVNPPLTVSASVPGVPLEVGQNGSFLATVSGGTSPVTVAWAFGDGNSSASGSATHAYATGGRFAVQLSVQDAAGARQWQNFTIQVLNATTGPGTGGPAGVPAWVWGVAAGGAAGAVALAAGVLLWRRRRRPRSPGPIAAAAVPGEMWRDDREAEGGTDTRSARRAQRWGGRR
jgi:PKD domain/Galactose oxidase, central domain